MKLDAGDGTSGIGGKSAAGGNAGLVGRLRDSGADPGGSTLGAGADFFAPGVTVAESSRMTRPRLTGSRRKLTVSAAGAGALGDDFGAVDDFAGGTNVYGSGGGVLPGFT